MFQGSPLEFPLYQISLGAALGICAWRQLPLLSKPITEGSYSSFHVSWPAALPLSPSQRLPSHHLWFLQNTLGSQQHWCDWPSLCHRQISLAPANRHNWDLVLKTALSSHRCRAKVINNNALKKKEKKTCFILASSRLVCSSLRRSFLLPTRMIGTFGQKCLTSGVHFSGIFSTESRDKSGAISNINE